MITTELFIQKFRKRFKFFYNSNIFFRDIHFTLVHDTLPKGQNLLYSDTEKTARNLVGNMISEGVITPISEQAFKVIDTKYQISTEKTPITA